MCEATLSGEHPNNIIVAQSEEADRVALSQSDHSGVVMTARRRFTTLGMRLAQSSTKSPAGRAAEAQPMGRRRVNIGNRKSAQEAAAEVTSYTANDLNQYTAIQQGSGETAESFTPTYDADGNQTLVKTFTGIWSVQYNAENRPVTFTNSESNTVVECTYDSMGRRATKKVTHNGSVTLHQHYIYRGYLQIAACDLTRSGHPCLWLVTWDLTKNICEVFGQHGYIRTTYAYTPYGAVTADGDVTQPIQWSSEYNDSELGLVYYNYRYYSSLIGRWLQREPIYEEEGALYNFCSNRLAEAFDSLGLDSVIISGGINTNIDKDLNHDKNWRNFITAAHTQIREILDKNKKECIVWLVEFNTYKTRGLNDFRNDQKYVDEIKNIAKQYKNVALKFFSSKKDLSIKLNKDASGTPRSALAKNQITQFYFYGHGIIGELVLDADMANGWSNKVSWTKEDIRGEVILLKSSISTKAYCDSWACNTATKGDGESFSEVWEEVYGSHLHGTIGKTDYSTVGGGYLSNLRAGLFGEYRKPTLGNQNDGKTPSFRN